MEQPVPLDVARQRREAHAYLDRLRSEQLSAVRSVLEAMLPGSVSGALANAAVEDEEIGEEEKHAVARSKEWFKNNQGTFLGGVAAELGFSMDEIRNGTAPA